jgi:hypothetical protein
MYPYLNPQASAPQTGYAMAANNNPNYLHDHSENRKRFTSNEQLMAGLDKFVRRYESKFYSRITILVNIRILLSILS